MDEIKLSKEIEKKLKEIRKLLIKNGGCQYLSMCIHENGTICFNNAHWDEERSKGMYLQGYVRGDE